MINRAPDKDLVFPGEKVVIPSLDAIKKLRKSRSLTVVNKIVKEQKDWIAKNGNVTTSNYALDVPQKTKETSGVKVEASTPIEEKTVVETPPVVQEPVVSETVPEEEVDYQKSSILPMILTIMAVVLVVGAMSFYLYRRKKKYEMEEFEPSDENDEITKVDDGDDDEEMFPEPYAEHEKEREREDVLVN